MYLGLHIMAWALPLIYALAFGAYLIHFVRVGREGGVEEQGRFAGTGLVVAGLVLHTLYFVLRGITLGFFPLGTKAEFLSLFALGVAAVYVVAERREGEANTGVFFLGIVLVLQILASALMGYGTQHPFLLENPTYSIHVIFMVLGFVGLSVGALYAMMYILLARQLKRHQLGVLFRRLPPLMGLERLSKTSTAIGVAALGLGIGLGYLVVWTSPGGLEGFSLDDPKIILADITWLAYVAGLIVVRWRGLGGLRVGWANVVAFSVLMTTMALTSAGSESIHAIMPDEAGQEQAITPPEPNP